MSDIFVVVRYNAPLQPIHRAHFEDPMDDWLRASNIGELTGGGSQLKEDGIEYSESEFMLRSRDHIPALISELEKVGIPKGSILFDGDEKVPLGSTEGLAIHLNNVDLPAKVYEDCDVNDLVEGLERVVGDAGRLLTYWSGQRETSLYFYGPAFDEMRAAAADLMGAHPLCQRCRVEQVA